MPDAKNSVSLVSGDALAVDVQLDFLPDGSRLLVGGLATDYCALNTVLDARRQAFDVLPLADAIRAFDVLPRDGERAAASMPAAGARPVSFADIAP